jgi:hypothetical protein
VIELEQSLHATPIGLSAQIKFRLRAAAIHLAISASLAVALVLLITTVWYPSPLFELAKGRDIFLILISCDITLGPVMTLIIFNLRKPRAELVRDLAIIATVQLAAMIYGVSTLLQGRPAYIVYNSGQFNVPLANEIVDGKADAKAGATADETAPAPWFGPKLVGAKLPSDVEENNRLLFSAVSGRGDVFQMPRYFVPYDDVKTEVIAHMRTAVQIAKELHVERSAVESATASYAKKGTSFGLLPLRVRTTIALAVVDRKSGDLLGIEPLPPAT